MIVYDEKMWYNIQNRYRDELMMTENKKNTQSSGTETLESISVYNPNNYQLRETTLPPKRAKKSFKMRWNKAYRVILIVLGILRILGVISDIGSMQLYNELNHSYYHSYTENSLYLSYDTLKFLTVILIILSIIRVILSFVLAAKLKELTKKTYITLIIYFIFNIIITILYTIITSSANRVIISYSVSSGIIAGFIMFLCILPIMIYYYKRRSLFGISTVCDGCGCELISDFEIHPFSIKNSKNIYYFCHNCYEKYKYATKESTAENNQPVNTDTKTPVEHVPKESEKKGTPKEKISTKQKSNKSQNISSVFKSKKSETESNVENIEIKFCRKCGAEIDEETVYCKKCGCKVLKDSVCASCGAQLDADSLFCKKCGKKIE